MARRKDVDAEIERLEKENLTIQELNAKSISIAEKFRDRYPNTFQLELKKSYVFMAVVELIKKKKK